MVIDLDSVKIREDGIPVDMNIHTSLFGERFQTSDNNRTLYEFLKEKVDPVLKGNPFKWHGKTEYGFMVWEITEQVVRDFLKVYYNEGDSDLYYHMDAHEIESYVDSLKNLGTFDNGKIFVVYGGALE